MIFKISATKVLKIAQSAKFMSKKKGTTTFYDNAHLQQGNIFRSNNTKSYMR